MDGFNNGTTEPQGSVNRFTYSGRVTRAEAAKKPAYRFHDAVLIVIVLSVWGYRLLAVKDS